MTRLGFSRLAVHVVALALVTVLCGLDFAADRANGRGHLAAPLPHARTLDEPRPVFAAMAGIAGDDLGARLAVLILVVATIFGLGVASSRPGGQPTGGEGLPDARDPGPIDLGGPQGEFARLAHLFHAVMASLERLSRHNTLVLNSAAEGIFGVDPTERVTFANAASARLFGCALNDFVGRSMHAVLRPRRPRHAAEGSAACPLCITLATRREEREADGVLLRPDGVLLPVEYKSTPVIDQGEPAGVVVTISDISERKRAEEEIRRQRDALYQREKVATMGALLADLAHELSNPLAALVARVAVLAEMTGNGSPLDHTEHIEHIERAAKRCSLILRSFLALARQRPAKREAVSLNDVVQAVVALLGYQLKVGDIEVVPELAPDLPLVWADPHQLHQVVVNLVTNARHAMRATPPPHQLTVTTRGTAAGARARLEVTDTGPGVSPELRSKIFEPFFTTKSADEGTGLGLALCQGIVIEHGGLIWVEAHQPRGARFVIELPVERRGAASPPAPAESVGRPGRTATILVVDDDADIASAIADVLIADGHQVETATDALLALDRLQHRQYDLILSDIKMPRLDGPAFRAEIERLHPHLGHRIVFVTGDTLSAETSRFLERTSAASLPKPFDISQLRRTIRDVLDSPERTGPGH